LKTGKKKTFAGALDWPGWCRSGRDEQDALQALIIMEALCRILQASKITFQPSVDVTEFLVVDGTPEMLQPILGHCGRAGGGQRSA